MEQPGKILLVGEQRSGILAHGVARLGPPLARLGAVSLLLCDPDSGQAADLARFFPGLAEIIVASPAARHPWNAESLAPWLVTFIRQEGFSHVAAPATSRGRDLLPRVAALMELPMVSEVVAILDRNTLQRPVMAGRGLATLRATGTPLLMTLRPSTFAPVTPGEQPVPVRQIVPAVETWGSRHLAFLPSPPGRPDIATAPVVVAGGQGVGKPENFHWIEALADRLNGAVGASRAAVDAGFAPNDWQIGQTGKIIAPRLYLAAGISGAIQHLAGIQGAEIIVAINHDPNAPILAISDYFLVDDLLQAIPEMVQTIDDE